jgi:glutamate racemase
VTAARAPIGVFDSGVGGLSVLRALRQALPGEDLLYVADSGHAPYGDRDAEFVIARAQAMSEFLRAAGAKAIVVACNTASVVAVAALRERCSLPIVAMEPAIKPAARVTHSGVVGVLATAGTVASANVERLCREHAGGARVLLQACPGLAECVERGELDSAATRALLQRYVEPLLQAGADTLVLGCTHYAFLAPALREIAGPGVALVDAAEAVARETMRRLGTLARGGAGAGVEHFFTTGALAPARARFSALWGPVVDVQPLVGAGQ